MTDSSEYTILEDENFKKLAQDKTDSEEFVRLVNLHVRAYVNKKRLSDALKDFTKKVEDAENRLIVARNVGKYKEPSPEDQNLTKNFTSFELKQKLQTLTVDLQTMIDEGSITHEEKPQVLQNLRERLEKAKAGGKEKLQEKLDKMLTTVVRADPYTVPVENIEEFHQLEKEIQAIQKLEKLPSKNLTPDTKKRIETKTSIQAEFDALMETSHLWFETVHEFKPRLYAAVTAWAADEVARKQREEEEAFEKKLAEEAAALEKKRAEVARKQAEADKALEEKLKAKRLEAEAKPVKEVPKKVVKEKKTVSTVDLRSMHHEEVDYEEIEAAEIQAQLEAEKKKQDFAKAYLEMHAAMKDVTVVKKAPEEAASAAKAQEALDRLKKAQVAVKKATKQAAAPAPKVKEEPVMKAKTEEEIKKHEEDKIKALEEKHRAITEKLAARRLEAQAKAASEPVKEAPKKKEVKAAVKMTLLDFYDEDLVLERLASQQAEEKKEKAVADAAAAEEEARWAADEEAAWKEEEAAWEAAEKNKIAALSAASAAALAAIRAAAPASDAKAAAPKTESAQKAAPKPRQKPVALANKWGAPTAAPSWMVAEDDGEDLLDKLAKQEAIEKKERAAAAEAAEAEAERLEAEEAAWAAKQGAADAPAVSRFAPSASDAKAAPSVSLVKPAAPKVKRKPPVEIASKWGAAPTWVSPLVADEDAAALIDEEAEEADENEEAAAAEEAEEGEEGEEGEEADAEAAEEPAPKAAVPAKKAPISANPSLAESMSMPKTKTPAPQPKKKEKKKWGKVDSSLMGFDY